MSSQHKYPPIGFRPPAALRERLVAHAAETGRPVGAIVTAAVDAYLGGTPPSGGELPPELPPAPAKKRTRQPRQPAKTLLPQAWDGLPDVPQPQDTCSHPNGRVHKGMCGACGTGGLT